MKLVKVSDLFEVKYGVNLELISLEECSKQDRNSVNFVSRTDKNNGVSAYVQKINEIQPNPAHTISVAGGGSVLATFFQHEQYYSGRDIYILIPKKQPSEIEMIFYCYCIRKNKYRYNYGRQANKTLKDILIPERIPNEWTDLDLDKLNSLEKKALSIKDKKLNIDKWKYFKLDEIFEPSLGKPIHREEIENEEVGKIAYVTRTTENNGVELFIKNETSIPTEKGGCITIGAEGFKAFYQPTPFITGNKVNIFRNKNLNRYNSQFILPLLNLEIAKKFNYGRGATKERLSALKVKFPVTNDGQLDWQFMEDYIKSISYSPNL
ncbi:MAG: restriction endonuclease subunit S [Patescibacteria group bacterium]